VSLGTVDRLVRAPLTGQTLVEAVKEYEKSPFGVIYDYTLQDKCKETFANAMKEKLYLWSPGDAIEFTTIEKGSKYDYRLFDDYQDGQAVVKIEKNVNPSGAKAGCDTVSGVSLRDLKKHCAMADPFEIMAKADNGNATAQYQLGLLYKDGVVLMQDDELAFFFFKKAAEQKSPMAQYQIGLMLERGIGCERDPVSATQYFRAAAEQGHTSAECYVTLAAMEVCVEMLKNSSPDNWISFTTSGLLRGNNQLISQTLCQTMLEQGMHMMALGESCVQARFVDTWVDCCQTEHAMTQGMVSELHSKMGTLADEGYAPAQYQFGMMLNDDPKVQWQYLEKAGKQGYAPAQYQLGLMLDHVSGHEQDSVQWLEKAANQQYLSALALGRVDIQF